MKAFDSIAPLGSGRRNFLKIGAAAGLVGLPLAQPMAATPMRKIAVEEHFTTADLEKRGLVARPTKSDVIFADIERRLRDFDELRLAAMDSAGIDMSVLSVTTPGVQGEKDAATAIRLAQGANDILARAVVFGVVIAIIVLKPKGLFALKGR